jgi:hypothetical protein
LGIFRAGRAYLETTGTRSWTRIARPTNVDPDLMIAVFFLDSPLPAHGSLETDGDGKSI